MEKKTPPPFKIFPIQVKLGILFLLLSWICNFFFLYMFWLVAQQRGIEFSYGRILVQMVVIVVLIFFYAVRIRNWARILSLTGNIIAITLYALLSYHFFHIEDIYLGMTAVLNVIMFTACSYFLFKRETADFYKLHSPRLGGEQNAKSK